MRIQGASKLPFGYFAVPVGNHVDSKSPLGVSVCSKGINHIAEADTRYSQINWEYGSKETAVHIAESLLKYRPDSDSFEYPGGKDRLYRSVEYSMGVSDKPLLDVFSPEIRDSSFYNGWNHLMRLIEFDCNLAYGTLSDPNNTDKTAEEVRASKQRSYSFVASCQAALQRALEDLVDAMSFWCDIYNLCPSGTCRLSASWDDSIVVDSEKERESDRQDVAMGVKEYTTYEALQEQRRLETLMRKSRQDIALLKEGGADKKSITLRQCRYRQQQQQYRSFSKVMKLPQQMERVYGDGLKVKAIQNKSEKMTLEQRNERWKKYVRERMNGK